MLRNEENWLKYQMFRQHQLSAAILKVKVVPCLPRVPCVEQQRLVFMEPERRSVALFLSVNRTENGSTDIRHVAPDKTSRTGSIFQPMRRRGFAHVI